jgi:hypothetical protein
VNSAAPLAALTEDLIVDAEMRLPRVMQDWQDFRFARGTRAGSATGTSSR